jgi:hypothetical protein
MWTEFCWELLGFWTYLDDYMWDKRDQGKNNFTPVKIHSSCLRRRVLKPIKYFVLSVNLNMWPHCGVADFSPQTACVFNGTVFISDTLYVLGLTMLTNKTLQLIMYNLELKYLQILWDIYLVLMFTIMTTAHTFQKSYNVQIYNSRTSA